MHIIEVECVCKLCQQKFTVKKQCRDMLDVEIQCKKISNRRSPICPKCYRAEKDAADMKYIDSLGLPDLIGGSSRQIDYADSLRKKYIMAHLAQITRVRNELLRVNPSLLANAATANGVYEEDYLEDALDRVGLKAAYLCVTEINAQRLIDHLKNER